MRKYLFLSLLVSWILTSCLMIKGVDEVRETYVDALWINNDSLITVEWHYQGLNYDSVIISLKDINDESNDTIIYRSEEAYSFTVNYIDNGVFYHNLEGGGLYYYNIYEKHFEKLSDSDWSEYLRYNALENEIIYISSDEMLKYYSFALDSESNIFDDINNLYYVDWERSRLIAGSRDYIVEIKFDSLEIDTIASYSDTFSIVVGLKDPEIKEDLYDSTRLLMRCSGTRNSGAIIVINNDQDDYSLTDIIDDKYFKRNSEGNYIELDDEYLWIFNESDDILIIYN